MSTTETRRPSDDWTTAVVPAVASVPVRRSILRPARPTPQDDGAPFEGWRGQAQTEELAAVPAPLRRNRHDRSSACRRTIARHLRSALIGTLLAIVAISGLSAYAAAGVSNALPTAPCQAHITCK